MMDGYQTWYSISLIFSKNNPIVFVDINGHSRSIEVKFLTPGTMVYRCLLMNSLLIFKFVKVI